MVLFYDKWEIFQFKMHCGYGYAFAVGEVKWNDDYAPHPIVLVIEKVQTKKKRNVKKLFADGYYVCQFMFDLNEECRGIAKDNKYNFIKRGYEIEYSYIDFNSNTFCNSVAIASRVGVIPKQFDITISDLFRECEFNFMSYKYTWYTMDISHKHVKKCNNEKILTNLPPFSKSIDTCLDWWAEGITVATWNNSYCDSIIEYRKESDRQDNFAEPSIKELLSESQTDDENYRKFMEQIINAIECFEKKARRANSTEKSVKKALTTLYNSIELCQTDNYCVETDDREKILEYVYEVLSSIDMTSLFDEMEELRNW